MRKQLLILIILTFAFGLGFGQSDTSTVYKDLQTKKFYSVSLHSETMNGKEIYEVNGKKVSKSTYEKYKSTWENMENCCPCILKSYDENDILLIESVSCTDCGVGWFKSYYPNGKLMLTGSFKENSTGNWENIWNRGYCQVRNGQWTYFNEKGDTLYSEFWNNGKFIKQVPEQDKIEIWDIELTFNGMPIDLQMINIDEIGKLKINPKFKNSNTKSNLEIRFEVSAIGHKPNEKRFSIESFKKIDVSKMLSEAGIPKKKDTTFYLSVYNENQLVKGFFLKVKK